MVYVFLVLLELDLILCSIPGMLRGQPWAIVAGLVCAVTMGIVGTLGILKNLATTS